MLKRNKLILWVSVMLSLGCVTLTLHASSIEQIDFDQLAQSAEVIFEAEVVAVVSRWNSEKTKIHTYIDFDIKDLIKGQLNHSSIRLQFLGGKVDQDEMRISGLIYPSLGEKGVYFVESLDTSMANPLLGWSQGHYVLAGDDSITTNSGAAVIEIQPRQKESAASSPSSGVARGLSVDSIIRTGGGMTKQIFKQEIIKTLNAEK